MLPLVVAAACASNLTLSGYICPTCPSAPNPAQLLAQIPAAYGIVNVAFIGWNADGTIVNQFDDPSKNFTLGKVDVAALQAKGKKVFVSIGGGAGGVISGDEPASFPENMATGIVGFAEKYGFNGVDFDIEHRTGDLLKCAGVINSVLLKLKQKKPAIGISFAPQMVNLDPDVAAISPGFNELAPVIGPSLDLIDWVQPQMYNSWAGVETLEYAKAYIGKLQAGYTVAGTKVPPIPGSRLLLGYPASPRGAGSGYLEPCSIVAMLRDVHPPIQGLMTWDIGWDQQAGWQFAQCVARG